MTTARRLLCSILFALPAWTSALAGVQSPADLYESIKARYLNSAKCHRYSYLPNDDQAALKIKLYQKEIETFRATKASPAFFELTPAMAIASIAHDFELDDAISTSISEEWWAIEASKGVDGDSKRVAFQSFLISKMKAKLDSNEELAAVQKRLNLLLENTGVTDDCDFISKDAFVAAYNAKSLLKQMLNKPNILTIIDRSLPKSDRRVITIDIKSGEVLFHSIAGFGDADGMTRISRDEGNICSNSTNSSATPYGMAYSVGKSRVANDRVNGFEGLGTLLATQKGAVQSLGFKERGIAIHSGGSDLFSGYGIDENHDKTMGEQLHQAMSMTATADDINSFLWRTSSFPMMIAVTNGCVAIPKDELPAIQKIVEDGSAVYFHCTPEMIR